jgi:hypothetical protein
MRTWLADRTLEVLDRLTAFLPELGELDAKRKFFLHSVSGNRSRGLTNLNETKWQCLRSRDVEIINKTIAGRQDLLDFFRYKVRDPDAQQDLRAAMMRSKALIQTLGALRMDAIRKRWFGPPRTVDRRNDAR